MLVAVAAVAGAILLWYILTTGVSAREQPGSLEEFAARRVLDKTTETSARRTRRGLVGELPAAAR
jgi:hypothetical protein